jgi:hypothetical protein
METTQIFADLLQLAGNHARGVMLGLGQPLMPTWVLLGADKSIHIVATPWRDDEEKEAMVKGLRRKMRAEKTLVYSFVMEAWTAQQPKGWKPDQAFVRPAQRPDRREVVLAFATDGHAIEWASWDIKREATTERVIALEAKPWEAKEVESWLTKLLDP